MSASRRPDLLTVLFLLGFATLLYADVLFAGNNLWFRDLFLYHFPMKQLVREMIARGEFPWWNPLFSGGQPMAANPAYEIFYPPQWLIFIGSYRFGFALHIVAHVWLALAGMYALLRAMSLRLEAALFGALSFGAGGLLTGSITNLPTFFVWSWAPLVACCALRYVQAPARGRFAAAAIVMAMPLVVSEPMALVQLWLLLLIGALMEDRRPRLSSRDSGKEDRRGRLSSIKPLAMMTAAAIGVAAVQLLPMLDHFRDSARIRGFNFTTVSDFSMPPMRPLELLVPHVFGYLDEHGASFWGSHAFVPRNGPYLLSIYCGLAVLILAIAGMAARLQGARIIAALLVASYVLALGSNTPLLAWLYAAGLRSIRYPEKFVAMGLVAAIVFAAWTAHRLLDGDERVRAVLLASAAIVSGATILTATATWIIVPSQWGALTSSAALTAIGLAIGWLAIAYMAKREYPVWRKAALVLLIAELGGLAAGFEPRLPRPFFEGPRWAVPLRNGTYFNRGEWHTADVNRTKFFHAYGPWTARNSLAPLTGAAWDISTMFDPDVDETFLLPTHDLLTAMKTLGNSGFPRWSEPFMIMSNVRYVSDYRDFDKANGEAGGDPLKLQPLQVRGARTQGRFFFPTQLITIANQEQLLASLRTNPFPFRTAFVPFPSFTPAPARVLGTRETSSTAAIDIESSGPSFLVVTITRHKYWRATIDGRDAQLLPANVAYMGLAVPPGRHRIELRYFNPIVVAGGIITLITLVIVALVLALALVRATPLHSAR